MPVVYVVLLPDLTDGRKEILELVLVDPEVVDDPEILGFDPEVADLLIGIVFVDVYGTSLGMDGDMVIALETGMEILVDLEMLNEDS